MSEDKIVPLFRAAPDPNDEARAEMVETLKRLLDRASAGKLQGLIFATVDNEGVIGTGWDGLSGQRWALGAAAGLLQHRYLTRLYEDAMG